MSEIFEILKLGDKELHNLFKEIVSKVNYTNPSQLISDCWAEYEKQSGGNSADSSKNRNGQFLELLVQYILCKNNILPFYKQAKVAFVPNVNFDALLYTKEIGSIVLSIKTSLRERYKQADLEAIALKQVHRRSKTFLLTLSDEYLSINKKIEKGDVAGLEKAINCHNSDFDLFIEELKKYTFIEAGSVEIVIGNLLKQKK
jgi:hypothetical protein